MVTMGPSGGTRVEILTRTTCFGLLAQVSVGRVGLSIDALPAILPVRFSLFDETVLFWSVPGTKPDRATVGHVVAFEADGHEPGTGTAWSVLLQGVAKAVSATSVPVGSAPADSGADGGPAPRLVQIQGTNVSGHRLLGTVDGPGGSTP